MAMNRLGPMAVEGAAADLGLGDMLRQQVGDESEELRKKRQKELADRQLLGVAGSAASTMLFGNGMGGGLGP